MKKYNIYYHADFDGVVSAYLITKVLNSKEKITYDLHPVNHDIDKEWLAMDLGENPVIVDFLYHPSAIIYYDHHKTSFQNEEHKMNFKEDRYNRWNPAEKSCAKLIYDNFKEYLIEDEELVEYATIVDSAGYKNVAEVYDYSNKYMSISRLVDLNGEDKEYLNNVVNVLLQGKIYDYLESEKETLTKMEENSSLEINMIKPLIKHENNLCYCDMTDLNIRMHRFLSYVYYPDIDYNIIVYHRGDNYCVSLAYNPWKKDENKIDLGSLAKEYGGGGHNKVAAMVTPSKEEAIRVSLKIKEKLIG